MTIAYQGAPGAFGHQACLAFLPGREAIAKASFAEVAAAVAAGEAELGMLPLENSRAGPVPGVAELIAASGLAVLAEHALPVRLHLLAPAGVRLAEIRTAVSHPMALRQCAASLARLGLATEEAENTAIAARDLAGRDRAALASEAAAALYGLTIVEADMQDDPGNATRFALVARRSAAP